MVFQMHRVKKNGILFTCFLSLQNMAAGHFKIRYGAHSMFLLDNSALEPTSGCQRLGTG